MTISALPLPQYFPASSPLLRRQADSIGKGLFRRFCTCLLLVGLGCSLSLSASTPICSNCDIQLQREIMLSASSALAAGTEGSGAYLPVFVHGNADSCAAAVASVGGSVRLRLPNLLTALLPRHKVADLAAATAVERLEAAARMDICRDSIQRDIGADLVHEGALPLPRGYSGQGVIVAVIDIGLDFRHPEFRRAGDPGASRILWLWDQAAQQGPGPPGYSYGREYSRSDIEDEIDGTPANAIDVSTLADVHGTHVASIAAGLGGIAPAAELIFVNLPPGQALSTNVAEAVDYVFGKAADLGRPCVVNISLGNQNHAMDGRDALSRALDALVAAAPGRFICAAAGNEGASDRHWGNFDVGAAPRWVYSAGGSCDLRLRVPDSAMASLEFSLSILRVSSKSREGSTQWRSLATLSDGAEEADTIFAADGQSPVAIFSWSSAGLGAGHREVQVSACASFPSSTHHYSIAVRGRGRFHSWGAFIANPRIINGGLPFDDQYQKPDKGVFLRSPAIANNVLAVGAYVNRSRYLDIRGRWHAAESGAAGVLSIHSSHGPSSDGRIKPDICAPGDIVIAARSSLTNVNAEDLVGDGSHMVLSGTSMACPATSGAVALLLERFPRASFASIREALISSARHDVFSTAGGPLPNSRWGHGKLDIFAALQAPTLTEVRSLSLSDQGPLLGIGPNPSRDFLLLHLHSTRFETLEIQVHSAFGTAMLRQRLLFATSESRQLRIDTRSWPAGLYLLRILADGGSPVNASFLKVN